jgi:hypothetical protein
MDPNATFDLMMAAVRAGDWTTAREHAEDLRDWLKGDGFPPDRAHAGDWLITVLTRGDTDAGDGAWYPGEGDSSYGPLTDN